MGKFDDTIVKGVSTDGDTTEQITYTEDDDKIRLDVEAALENSLDFREIIILLRHIHKQSLITNYHLAELSDREVDEGDEQ